MVAARFLVRGKVQGVWFRASARIEAVASGLRGYVRNLANGDVEVLAIGEADAIERLAAWLQHGPSMARVDAVQRFAEDAGTEVTGFEVL